MLRSSTITVRPSHRDYDVHAITRLQTNVQSGFCEHLITPSNTHPREVRAIIEFLYVGNFRQMEVLQRRQKTGNFQSTLSIRA